ncbi:MAG TPA: ABC transporter ATP-binding protein [Pyrinomonadaceae bacterium]|jgi:putative spermidine/putrescine transport system ATP-binding protein
MSLRVENLSKRYDQNWVLRDVSFEAEEGEILGIFGLTGAGKSTLIRVISGTENCSGGKIYHESSDVTMLSCDDRNFHFPRITNDSFWKSIFKTDKTSILPDGEGQVIALNEGLEKADSVLLLDDSFCYMDALLRYENYKKLKDETRRQKLVVLIATNDFDEAMMLCDRVIVIDNGEVLQTGAPAEVYLNPASAKVAYISGRNNLIEARRLTSNKTEIPEFQTIDGEHRLFTGKAEKSRFAPLNQNNILTIRPEHISISFGASFPEDNLLKAKITDVRFQGATTLVVLDANGLKLEALVLRLVGLNIGEECMVGLPPDRILVFKK